MFLVLFGFTSRVLDGALAVQPENFSINNWVMNDSSLESNIVYGFEFCTDHGVDACMELDKTNWQHDERSTKIDNDGLDYMRFTDLGFILLYAYCY